MERVVFFLVGKTDLETIMFEMDSGERRTIESARAVYSKGSERGSLLSLLCFSSQFLLRETFQPPAVALKAYLNIHFQQLTTVHTMTDFASWHDCYRTYQTNKYVAQQSANTEPYQTLHRQSNSP